MECTGTLGVKPTPAFLPVLVLFAAVISAQGVWLGHDDDNCLASTADSQLSTCSGHGVCATIYGNNGHRQTIGACVCDTGWLGKSCSSPFVRVLGSDLVSGPSVKLKLPPDSSIILQVEHLHSVQSLGSGQPLVLNVKVTWLGNSTALQEDLMAIPGDCVDVSGPRSLSQIRLGDGDPLDQHNSQTITDSIPSPQQCQGCGGVAAELVVPAAACWEIQGLMKFTFSRGAGGESSVPWNLQVYLESESRDSTHRGYVFFGTLLLSGGVLAIALVILMHTSRTFLPILFQRFFPSRAIDQSTHDATSATPPTQQFIYYTPITPGSPSSHADVAPPTTVVPDKIKFSTLSVYAREGARPKKPIALRKVVVSHGDEDAPRRVWTGPPSGQLDSVQEGDELTVHKRSDASLDGTSGSHALPCNDVALTAKGLENEHACVICLFAYATGDQLHNLPCDHVFHNSCISQWLTQHTSCPVCRCELVAIAAD